MATAQGTTARGYGSAHQAERKRWEPTVKAGQATCHRCNEPIKADGPWDLGHNDDRTAWTGPEHVKCNRAAGQANSTDARMQRNQTFTADW